MWAYENAVHFFFIEKIHGTRDSIQIYFILEKKKEKTVERDRNPRTETM